MTFFSSMLSDQTIHSLLSNIQQHANSFLLLLRSRLQAATPAVEMAFAVKHGRDRSKLQQDRLTVAKVTGRPRQLNSSRGRVEVARKRQLHEAVQGSKGRSEVTGTEHGRHGAAQRRRSWRLSHGLGAITQGARRPWEW